MADKKRCRTNLIPDDPEDADAFGSHGRVADAIVDVVRKEVGGKSIGLEGGWGSGKSTIVRLVRDRLTGDSNDEHEVFVFDTWAHQGDPLRRTFLENLISQAKGWKGVDKKKWKLKRDELAKRRREDTTRVIPRLTVAGFLFAFVLLGIPLGSALIAAGATLFAANDPPENVFEIWQNLLVRSGIWLLLAPAILSLLAIVVRKFLGGLTTKGGRCHRHLEEFTTFLTGQASTETNTIVTQTPDPTSVEFESVFRDLLQDALGKNDKKLLLVIDNLDRVQLSDALSIWSTLQTFLGHSDYREDKWLNRLWVLVPYDREGILRLWDHSDGAQTKSPNQTLTESFLDKTFQIRFNVPPLLLSKWHDFLEKSLKCALPDHDEPDRRDVYRAFGMNGGLDKSPPTPRDLKIFVNQIGALHRERQPDFKLSDYACYVLFKKNVNNVHQTLLLDDDKLDDDKLDDDKYKLPKRIMGDRWREVIAAIHFGVDKNEARQLLLRGPIESALAEGDGSTLSDLASDQPEAFWAVLDDSVPGGGKDWNSLVPDDIAKAATALLSSGVFDQANDRREAEDLRQILRNAALSVRSWVPFDARNAQGMVALVRLADGPKTLVPALFSRATKAFPGQVPSDVWMASALTFVDGLIKSGFEEHIGAGLQIPLDANHWVDVSGEIALRDPDGQLLQYCEIKDVEQFDQRLSQLITNRKFDDEVLHAVQTAIATKSRHAFENTAKAALNVHEVSSFQVNELPNAMQALRLLDSANLFEEGQYANLATSGRFLNYLSLAHRNGNQQAIAECMFGHLRFVPDARATRQSGDSVRGRQYLHQLLQNPNSVPDAVHHFADLVTETRQFNIVFEMASGQDPVNQFTTEVLRKVLNATGVSMPNDLVRENWRTIREALGTGDGALSFETFLKGLDGYEDLVDIVTAREFVDGESGLYVGMLNIATESDFAEWCGSGLNTVDESTWANEIASPGDIVSLVTRLRAGGTDLKLGLTCYDALVDRAEEIAYGESDLLTKRTWDVLVTSLDLDRQKLLPSDVYGILEKSIDETSEEFFGLFGDMLSDRILLVGSQGFIRRVCRGIIETGNESGIAWLADIAVKDPQVFKAHKSQVGFTDFAERVRLRLETPGDDSVHRHLRRIGEALGI